MNLTSLFLMVAEKETHLETINQMFGLFSLTQICEGGAANGSGSTMRINPGRRSTGPSSCDCRLK